MKIRNWTASWGICISVAFGWIDAERRQMTEPDGDQTERQGRGGVGTGLEPFAFLRQGQVLEAEGRKSSVAAAHTRHEELAKGRRNQQTPFGVGDGSEKADGETSTDVDQQGA